MEIDALLRSDGTSGDSRERMGGDLVLAAVTAVVAMMTLPIPTFVPDALVTVNTALAVMLAMTGIYMREALRFKVEARARRRVLELA